MPTDPEKLFRQVTRCICLSCSRAEQAGCAQFGVAAPPLQNYKGQGDPILCVLMIQCAQRIGEIR